MNERMKELIAHLKTLSDQGSCMDIPSGLSAGQCWFLALELEQFINKQWLDLTNEEILTALNWIEPPKASNKMQEFIDGARQDMLSYGRAIEAKLKEKNNG